MKKLLFLVFFGYIFSPLCAANSTYYITEGTIEERLREGIEYAWHRVDICIHDFAALDIAEYLDDARRRGAQVRVMMIEQESNGAKGLLAEKLIDRGIDVRTLKTQLCGRPVQDFIILDNNVLVTGVYNWMAYRNRSICSDVVFHYDAEIILNYKDTFWRLFTDAEVVPPVSSKKDLVVSNNHPLPGTVASVKQTVQGDNKGQMAAAESPKPATEVISRDFIDVSFEEMDEKFGKESGLSRSEKNELWKKYKGKYVRWQGVVAYKGMGRVDWNRVGVNRQRGKNAEVEILFDWRRFEAVMNIRLGSTITYTGKLVSRPGINAPYRLDDGDIE
ncbi:MAG: phospholipase D-like domain-containing protein [Candidatus Brocadiales bacterium]|nr:phospholipase D-like domain-containing protein [Candidatus Brocadiales bacterium]